MGNNKQSLSTTRHAAGCVVHSIDKTGTLRILLIRDPYGRWTLPKGHLEGNETEAEAAVREVLEETGVSGVLGPLVGMIRYAIYKHGIQHEKRVTFFLMSADSTAVTPQHSEGISAAGWYPSAAALRMIGYDQVRGILTRALELLNTSPPDPV